MGQERRFKHFYSPYWDFRTLGDVPLLKPELSVVIATYNRSPFPPGNRERNPLELLFWSLAAQKGVKLREIVVVDDGSRDHTPKVVEHWRPVMEGKGIELVYRRNPHRLGSAASRNLGIRLARSSYIYLTDDDCIPTPYALFGGLLLATELDGVVDLPVYYRATVPTEFRPLSRIGAVDFQLGIKEGGLDAYPREYLQRPRFWDRGLGILMPLEIEDLNANFIGPKGALLAAGGFPEDLPWRNSFSEESELAQGLLEAGYRIYLLPDPKFHAVHLRFGHSGRGELLGPDWSGGILGEAVRWANVPREDTGNRLQDAREYYSTKILANFRFFWKRDPEGARRYLLRQLETAEEFDGKYYPIPPGEIRSIMEGIVEELGEALPDLSLPEAPSSR